MLLEQRLCTPTQLKTELVGDALQMEVFGCRRDKHGSAWWGPGPREDHRAGEGLVQELPESCGLC